MWHSTSSREESDDELESISQCAEALQVKGKVEVTNKVLLSVIGREMIWRFFHAK